MSLHITLDNPAPPFHPGQPLTGTLTYPLPKQRKINTITISLRGKIDTEHIAGRTGTAGNTHGPRRRAHETLRLFQFTTELFKGPYTVPPQTFVWPFTFTIPTHIEVGRVGNKFPGFIPDGVSPLPPSFDWEDHTISHDCRARIKYKLVATVDSGGLFKNEDVELPLLISRFSPIPPPSKPSAAQITPHEFQPSPTVWQSRELRAQAHTFKQKFKHLTSNDPELKTPCIAFRAVVRFPDTLDLGQRFPVSFGLTHQRMTANDPETPELVLESVKLILKSHVAMLAGRTSYGPSLDFGGDRFAQGTNHEASFEFPISVPVPLPLNGEAVVLGETRLGEWRRHREGMLGGDFASYTVRRGHRVKVEAGVRHVGTGHVFLVRGEWAVRLLDGHVPGLEGVGGGVNVGVGVGVSRREGDVDEELPGYHEDVRPPVVDGEEDGGGQVERSGKG